LGKKIFQIFRDITYMSKLLEQLNNTKRQTYVIKDMGRVVTGKTPSKDNPEDWGFEIDFITPTDFSSDNKHLVNIKRKISLEGSVRYKNMIIQPQSVVVTCIGSDMGKVVISKDKALTNQQINSIIVDTSAFDINFSYYALKALYPTLRSIAEEGGSTMPIITKSVFEQIEFDAPNLPTQKKIASILSAYDAKIENNNKIIKNLEATAQTIFNEWFVEFHFPGYEKVKMVESEMGEIPEGWEVLKLKEIFTFIKGKKPSEVSEVQKENFLQQILIDSFESGKKLFADKNGMVVASDEDLLMVMDGASSGRIEFGISGVVGSTLSKLDLKRSLRSILYFYLKTKEKDIKENTTGSAIPHTDKDKVYNYEVVLPKNTDFFENKLFKFIDYTRKLKEENISLKSQRNQLLAKLI